MAKEILDIYVEQGYPYDFDLDFNASDGSNLESSHTCYFFSNSIGIKQFSIVDNKYNLVLGAEDTGKLVNNLEAYDIYAYETSTGSKIKLLSGRIILDGTSNGELNISTYTYVPGEW